MKPLPPVQWELTPLRSRKDNGVLSSSVLGEDPSRLFFLHDMYKHFQ